MFIRVTFMVQKAALVQNSPSEFQLQVWLAFVTNVLLYYSYQVYESRYWVGRKLVWYQSINEKHLELNKYQTLINYVSVYNFLPYFG